MKVIYDIDNIEVKQKLIQYINNYYKNILEVDYSNISEPIIIFKELLKRYQVKTIKNLNIPSHTLIPVIDKPELIFESLEYQPLSYIRISHLIEDLKSVCHLIDKIQRYQDKILTLKTRYSYINIKTSSIYAMESFGHYLTVHTENGEYIVREKLSKFVDELKDFHFIQIHKSYLINKKYIRKIDSSEIEMVNALIIPIGKKYKERIKEEFR